MTSPTVSFVLCCLFLWRSCMKKMSQHRQDFQLPAFIIRRTIIFSAQLPDSQSWQREKQKQRRRSSQCRGRRQQWHLSAGAAARSWSPPWTLTRRSWSWTPSLLCRFIKEELSITLRHTQKLISHIFYFFIYSLHLCISIYRYTEVYRVYQPVSQPCFCHSLVK